MRYVVSPAVHSGRGGSTYCTVRTYVALRGRRIRTSPHRSSNAQLAVSEAAAQRSAAVHVPAAPSSSPQRSPRAGRDPLHALARLLEVQLHCWCAARLLSVGMPAKKSLVARVSALCILSGVAFCVWCCVLSLVLRSSCKRFCFALTRVHCIGPWIGA